MLPAAAFEFLRGLAANNERAWLEANRSAYETAVKQPVAAATTELSKHSQPLECEPKRFAYRINRDMRFSHDKSPYKTSVGIAWYPRQLCRCS